ncbi:10525_t:CDS:1 [Paraglomus occultum]|uniref:10525_t:CDS:1 n=1 Tax=Paraglomus occultum TaxID=144539 RepID=A0A9N8WMH5_9GLOM|nr:10525_t:CDS:1 [Paraglomus occultum]
MTGSIDVIILRITLTINFGNVNNLEKLEKTVTVCQVGHALWTIVLVLQKGFIKYELLKNKLKESMLCSFFHRPNTPESITKLQNNLLAGVGDNEATKWVCRKAKAPGLVAFV